MCHVAIVDMKRLSPVAGLSSPFKFDGDSKVLGFGVGLKRKVVVRKTLKFVVKADLSKSFSTSLGLDSQVFIFFHFIPFHFPLKSIFSFFLKYKSIFSITIIFGKMIMGFDQQCV